MHLSLLERLSHLFSKSDSGKLELSRSRCKQHLGNAARRRRYLGLATVLVAACHIFQLEFSKEGGRLNDDETPVRSSTKEEVYGPIKISGELNIDDVWARQKAAMASGIECPAEPRAPIFMVLTTIPSRLSLLAPMLATLLQQTFPVDILLAVPTEYRRFSREETESLLALTALPEVSANVRVHVLHGDDFGPGSKLLFPLSRLEGAEAYLLPIDDDQMYAPTLACDLLVVGLSYPERAITRRSRVFPKQHCSTYTTSSLVGEETVRPGQPRVLHGSDLVMGTSGYLVKSSFFDDSVFAYDDCPSAPREALLLNDDIWISGQLRRRGIEIIVSLSGFRSSLDYTTGKPEVRRVNNGLAGLWAGKKTREGEHRRLALNAFFGVFCVPTRTTWRSRDSVCKFRGH